MNIDIKKTPRHLLIFLLTVSAVLCFGFLSFGGVFVLPWSSLGIAIASYVFYVVYDGEIYQQNIKAGLKKLLTFDYLETRLTGEFLQENLAHKEDNTGILDRDDCPQFFHEYAALLKKHAMHGKKKDKKKLKAMEEILALHLFSTKELADDAREEDKALRAWIRGNFQEKMLEKMKKRTWQFRLTLAFSVLTSLFTTAGLFFLLSESVAALPFMVTLLAIPGAQIPVLCIAAVMVFFASVAYGFCVYNAITDMINNDTIKTWYAQIRNRLQEGITFKSVFLALASVVLVGLALFLTGCTAGTWWTIAKNAKPFCVFMTGKGKEVAFVLMGIVNPIIEFFSNLFFNVENVSETFKVVEELVGPDGEKNASLREKWHDFVMKLNIAWAKLHMRENKAQIYNPFRIFIVVTLSPLMFVLFICHLVSAAMEGDRAPFVPPILAFVMEFLSEAGEHGHYFWESDCHGLKKDASLQDMLNARFSGGGHTHNTNLPLLIVKTLYSPVILFSALWNWGFSQWNTSGGKDTPQPVGFFTAVKKAFGVHDHDHHHHHKQEDDVLHLEIPGDTPVSSMDLLYVDHQLEKQKNKLERAVVDQDTAMEKSTVIDAFQKNLREREVVTRDSLKSGLKDLAQDRVVNKARFFGMGKKTTTHDVIGSLAKAI